MKILIAGDTHGNMAHVITLLDNAVAQGCRRVFQVGDFGAWIHVAAGRKFLDDVHRHARARNVTVYWLDGNHDPTGRVMQTYGQHRDKHGFVICRPRVRYAPRGHFWTWESRTFIAFGGAYSIDKQWRLAQELHDAEHYGKDTSGTLWFPEEEMTEEEFNAYLAAAPHRVDVMLTHDKPRSSNPRWNRKDILECWPNQDRIEQALQKLRPKMLFHGHLHYRYGDLVRHNGGFTEVIGLDSDPSSSYSGNSKNSWIVLDLKASLSAERMYCDECGDHEPGTVSGRRIDGTIWEAPCDNHLSYLHP